jgi:hypothetical protein
LIPPFPAQVSWQNGNQSAGKGWDGVSRKPERQLIKLLTIFYFTLRIAAGGPDSGKGSPFVVIPDSLGKHKYCTTLPPHDLRSVLSSSE